MDEITQLISSKQFDQAKERLRALILSCTLLSDDDLKDIAEKAAQFDAVEIIELLQAYHPWINTFQSTNGNTLLHVAATHQSVNTIRVLVRMDRESVMKRNMYGQLPLVYAGRFSVNAEETFNVLYQFYKHMDLNFFKKLAVDMIMAESRALVYLIDIFGASILNQSGRSKETLLVRALYHNGHPDVIEKLCQFRPEDIDVPYLWDGVLKSELPMHIAAESQRKFGWKRFLILHRHGSQAHFEKDGAGESPIDFFERNPPSYLPRRCYFSRSLAEALFFVYCADEITSSRRTQE